MGPHAGRIGCAAVALPVALMLFVIAAALGAGGGSAGAAPGRMCIPADAGDGSVAGYGPAQLDIAATIVAVGKQRGLGSRAWLIAVMAGMVESRLRNLEGGHADSLGVFQQRPSQGWGTRTQILNVEFATNSFYDALVEVEGWKTMPPGQAAQAVQRSALPQRYKRFVDEARQVIGAVRGAECTSLSGRIDAVIQTAKSQIGAPYAWGGGTVHGPSEGTGVDAGVVGFDCSSLVMYAYYQGTGGKVTLPRVTYEQYPATADHQVPPDQLAPGDLLFYGSSPATLHHVAMYLGGGKMIEAPQSGMTVRITKVRLGGDFYAATRVLTGDGQ